MDRLGNYINQFSEAFGNVYGAINPQRPPASTANRDARQSQQWLPFAIGGGVLLLVVVLILGTRK